MKIGKIIKRLRLAKELTQEDLAEKLNITVSAVSQWEMDKTMPDISMIPLLVDMFGVSADELLGIRAEETECRVTEYIEKGGALYAAGQNEEMVTLLAEAYREFPTNMRIVDYYSFALDSTLATHPERVARCIELDKKILDRSLDDKVRFRAIRRLSSAFSHKGDTESARFYAGKLPQWPSMCAQNLMREYGLLPDEDKIPYYQATLNMLMGMLDDYVTAIADPDYKNPCASFSYKERIDMLAQSNAAILAMYGAHACDKNSVLSSNCRVIGALYLLGKEPERALDYFEMAYEYAVQFKYSYKEGDAYTSPVLCGFEPAAQNLQYGGVNAPLLAMQERFATQERYRVFAGNPRFVALKNKIAAEVAREM